MSIVRRCARVTGSGIDGCDSTAARSRSSAAIANANPPVKHMPTAPTPGPPHAACSRAASARSQVTIGEVFPVASLVNSRRTQSGAMARTP